MNRRRLELLARQRAPRARAVAMPREDIRLRWIYWTCVIAIVLLVATAARADDGAVTVVAPSSAVRLKAGQSAVVPVKVQVPAGWHIFGAQPLVGGVKPAVLTLGNAAGVTVLPITLPSAKKVHVGALNADANVYENTFTVQVKVKADAGATPGARSLSGQLSYQACSDQKCLFPKKLSFSVPVNVVK